jgi:LysR family glycine cleavage system transcriptional activator
MYDLPLNALRAFAAVYEHGGVRAAARALGVTHSSMSRHVAGLEAWLGAQLFRDAGGRNGRAMTATGEVLGKAAVAGMREIERAVAAIREARSEASVVISTTASFATRWLLPRLARFERRHPKLELSVIVEQRLVEVDGGGIDLAIRMGRGPWRGLDCEPLMDDALYPVTSARYWQAAGRPARPAALARLRLLHDRDPATSWELWRENHGPTQLDVRRGPRFASSDLVLRAAAEGQGVALARHRLAAADLASGALMRPFGDLRVELGPSYWLVVPTHGRSRPATAATIAWLQHEAADGS